MFWSAAIVPTPVLRHLTIPVVHVRVEATSSSETSLTIDSVLTCTVYIYNIDTSVMKVAIQVIITIIISAVRSSPRELIDIIVPLIGQVHVDIPPIGVTQDTVV